MADQAEPEVVQAKTFNLPPGTDLPSDVQTGDTLCIYATVTATDNTGTSLEFQRAEKESGEEQETPASSTGNPQVDYVRGKRKGMMMEEGEE